MQQQKIIEKARKFRKKNFLTEAFGKRYLEFCDAGYVQPDKFIELVDGTRNNVFPMRRVVSPEMDIEQYFEIVICQAKGEHTYGKTNKSKNTN